MPGLYLSCINMGLKYTLNAFELNWQDVAAVMVGMAVLTLATVFHGPFSWSEGAAIGWGAGEGSLLISRLLLLWKHKRHDGVPVGIILGATASLVVMIGPHLVSLPVQHGGWTARQRGATDRTCLCSLGHQLEARIMTTTKTECPVCGPRQPHHSSASVINSPLSRATTAV